MSNKPFTLVIPYVPSKETWEDYALRCADIANYVVQRSAHLAETGHPLAIDVSTMQHPITIVASRQEDVGAGELLKDGEWKPLNLSIEKENAHE